MMALSSATAAFSGTTEDASEKEKAYNTFDVDRIDENGRRRPQVESTMLGSKESQIYGQLIRDQLEVMSKSRDSSNFNAMLGKLLSPDDESKFDDKKIFTVLRTLSRELEKLDKGSVAPVLSTFLDFEKWSELSPSVTEGYIQFFNVLMSANPKWWPEVAKKMISQFGDSRLDLSPHHTVLRHIIKIVPTSTATLSSIYTATFPHKSCSSAEITAYIRNLLKLVEYAPEQLHAAWELIIQHLVELDVECEDPEEVLKRRDSESDSESDESESESDGDLSDDDSDSSSGSDNESDSDSASDISDSDSEVSDTGMKRTFSESTLHSIGSSSESKKARIDDVDEGEEVTTGQLALMQQMEMESMPVKVDAIMTLLLQKLSSRFTYEAVTSGQSTTLFKVLLQVFRDIVLPTSRPRSVQFLWFYITHAHRDLLASYLSLLLEVAMSSDVSYDLRTRSMQYVASFVGRAKGLSREQIVFIVNFLADWVQRFIRERESEVDGALSMARFQMFYSIVQCLFYIFVFRHGMLRTETEDGKGGQWEAGLDKLFQQVVNTKFNPLQYCQPQVVATFAQVAQNEQVASCYSIIERNRWGRFRSQSTENSGDRRTSASNGLFANNRDSKLYDSFLPFEPLCLRGSRKYMKDIYEKWSEHDLTDSDTEREREMEDSETDSTNEEQDSDSD